jgi:uncharacterized protein
MNTLPTVSSLHLYPVKSLRGHDVPQSRVERIGLADDRRWVVTDLNGRLLTQREIRRMAQISVVVTSQGIEMFHAEAGHSAVEVPGAESDILTVTVWRFTGPARRANATAEAWLSAVLSQAVYLAYMHDTTVRAVNPLFGTVDDRVSFADGYPVLITNEASLADLNQRGESAHVMRQFRPNLVVSGARPWEEDTWQRIRIGSLTLRIVKPCDRCIVTTLDPVTGTAMPQEQSPLGILAKFHRSEAGIMFGQNAIPDAEGVIHVGDDIEVLETGITKVAMPSRRN